MFNTLLTDPQNELIKDRLQRLSATIGKLGISTREEYLAEVYSRVNRIIAAGNNMMPLTTITPEGPAKIGDLTTNIATINQDAADIVSYLLRLEDLASQLYNLSAASQNNLRQDVRELVFAPDQDRYIEDFVHTRNISASSGMIDINAGLANLPLISETELSPVISIGTSSVGQVVVDVDALTDGRVDTAFVWSGSSVELLMKFSPAAIVNRVAIELDDYQGLEIVSFTTSPDGNMVEDVLETLGQRTIHLNGIQSKFSGDCIIDFPARFATTIRIVIEDRIGDSRIALRSMSAWLRKYQDSGTITTNPISAPSGKVKLVTDQLTSDNLTSISHQISYDGVQFTGISTDTTISLTSSPFWYRAILSRASARFADQDTPVAKDPTSSSDYTLISSNSVPIGNNILERTMFFQSVNGPIRFLETPIQGSLIVQEGSAILSPSTYAFSNNILSFPVAMGSVTITYQASLLGLASLGKLKDYYTPLLYEFQFQESI